MPLCDGVFVRLPTLETPRLVLRKMRMTDAEDLHEYSSDREVARFVLWDAHENMRDTREYLRYALRQYRNDEPASFGMIYKPDDKLIGTIGFMNWNRDHDCAEVGYSLSRRYWNMGLMTEALLKVIDFGFSTMRLHRIEAMHMLENSASGRVMEKCGMKFEGIARGKILCKGEYADVAIHAILRGDKRGR